MPTEREWVASLAPRLEQPLQGNSSSTVRVKVEPHKKLLYAHEVFEYDSPLTTKAPIVSDYQTDLLIFDDLGGGKWTPRVVVECKLGSVTTHDALTYSAKASTHKQVHPYVRYGILIGDLGQNAVPGRLFRHGTYFDFMVAWSHTNASPEQWERFVEMLGDEIKASRQIARILTENRLGSRQKFEIVHRPLRLKKSK